jgi:hypothetical protein
MICRHFENKNKPDSLTTRRYDTRTWQQVKEIFQSAIERPPSERDGFISQACAETRTYAARSNPSSPLMMKLINHFRLLP